jgi:hypothetical protein
MADIYGLQILENRINQQMMGCEDVFYRWQVNIPRTAGQFMFNLLNSMNFHLITGLGRSHLSYNNMIEDEVGQGVLQRCSSAAPIYILSSDVSLSTYKKIASGAAFTHPMKKNGSGSFGIVR